MNKTLLLIDNSVLSIPAVSAIASILKEEFIKGMGVVGKEFLTILDID